MLVPYLFCHPNCTPNVLYNSLIIGSNCDPWGPTRRNLLSRMPVHMC
jgi:hypothetical protein